MRLKDAPGGPELIRALSNPLVSQIVESLLQIVDQEFFRDIANFLNKYNQRSQEYFTEALNDLRTATFPDEEGLFPIPSYVDKLVSAIESLYQHNERNLGYLRGALVEKLAFRLVAQRCLSDECFSNQMFLDEHGKEVTGQIDVAVLSKEFAEGYECKMRARGDSGLKSEDCDNLKALVNCALEEGYYVHVGVICFENDSLVRSRLKHWNAPSYIQAYGLDSIAGLLSLPEYIEPDDDIARI